MSRQRLALTRSNIPYCDYEKSPVTLKIAVSVIGPSPLKCGGKLDVCQISPEDLVDWELDD